MQDNLKVISRRIKGYWDDVLAHISPDLAYVWTEDVRKDFHAIENEAERLLLVFRRLRSKYSNEPNLYQKHIDITEKLIEDIHNLKNGPNFVKEFHDELFELLAEISSAYNKPIKGKSYKLNTRYRKNTKARDKTLFIILGNTLDYFPKAVHRLRNGLFANFLINRNGTVYEIVANGDASKASSKSLWQGISNINQVSVSIDLEGHYFSRPTSNQYHSLKLLIDGLQSKYSISDKEVLALYQVSCWKNPSTNLLTRGGDLGGINIDWRILGIGHNLDDKDAASGKIKQDPILAKFVESESKEKGIRGLVSREPPEIRARKLLGSNLITKGKSAIEIAKDQYNDSNTYYNTGNKIFKGNHVKDWKRLPLGTRVYLNFDLPNAIKNSHSVIVLEHGKSPWAQLQAACIDPDTYYIPPGSSQIHQGDKSNIDSIKPGTRIVLDCASLGIVNNPNTPIKIAGNKYNTEKAVYVLPDGDVKTGKEVQVFNKIPIGTKIIVKR